MNETLTERSPELAQVVARAVGDAIGMYEPINVYEMNTGGGCYVLVIDLSQNTIDRSREMWLSRDSEWLLGFYDYSEDDADYGVCVTLNVHNKDDANLVAEQVAGIVRRMGIGLKDA